MHRKPVGLKSCDLKILQVVKSYTTLLNGFIKMSRFKSNHVFETVKIIVYRVVLNKTSNLFLINTNKF